MLIHRLRLRLRAELEAPSEQRRFGSGWLSGIAALAAALASLILGLCDQHNLHVHTLFEGIHPNCKDPY